MGSSLDLGKIARALSDRAKLFDGSVAKVGIPAGKTYPDGTSIGYIAAIQEYGADVPAHEVVAKNGKALAIPVGAYSRISDRQLVTGGAVYRKRAKIPAMKIPPRPFMRNTRTEKAAEWGREIAAGASAVAQRRLSLEGMLEAVGHSAAMDVVQTISNRVGPPLKPSTVEGRIRRAQRTNAKFGAKSVPVTISQPLNDTGALVAHISYGTGPSGAEFENGKTVK